MKLKMIEVNKKYRELKDLVIFGGKLKEANENNEWKAYTERDKFDGFNLWYTHDGGCSLEIFGDDLVKAIKVWNKVEVDKVYKLISTK